MARDYDEMLLLGYVEGELSAADRAKVEQWMQADPALNRLVTEMANDRNRLRVVSDPTPPDWLMDEVDLQLERMMLVGGPAEEAQVVVRQRYRLKRWVWGGAIAATITIVAGIIVSSFFDLEPQTDMIVFNWQEKEVDDRETAATPAPQESESLALMEKIDAAAVAESTARDTDMQEQPLARAEEVQKKMAEPLNAESRGAAAGLAGESAPAPTATAPSFGRELGAERQPEASKGQSLANVAAETTTPSTARSSTTTTSPPIEEVDAGRMNQAAELADASKSEGPAVDQLKSAADLRQKAAALATRPMPANAPSPDDARVGGADIAGQSRGRDLARVGEVTADGRHSVADPAMSRELAEADAKAPSAPKPTVAPSADTPDPLELARAAVVRLPAAASQPSANEQADAEAVIVNQLQAEPHLADQYAVRIVSRNKPDTIRQLQLLNSVYAGDDAPSQVDVSQLERLNEADGLARRELEAAGGVSIDKAGAVIETDRNRIAAGDKVAADVQESRTDSSAESKQSVAANALSEMRTAAADEETDEPVVLAVPPDELPRVIQQLRSAGNNADVQLVSRAALASPDVTDQQTVLFAGQLPKQAQTAEQLERQSPPQAGRQQSEARYASTAPTQQRAGQTPVSIVLWPKLEPDYALIIEQQLPGAALSQTGARGVVNLPVTIEVADEPSADEQIRLKKARAAPSNP